MLNTVLIVVSLLLNIILLIWIYSRGIRIKKIEERILDTEIRVGTTNHSLDNYVSTQSEYNDLLLDNYKKIIETNERVYNAIKDILKSD